MKTLKLVLLAAMTAAMTMVSCKSNKEVTTTIQKEEGAKEITLPFMEEKYQSDAEYFRSRNNGKSPDLSTAKKIALMNAKNEMAGSIQSLIKAVSDQYTNQYTVGDKMDFENKFEELSRLVVNQKLNDVRTIGEKVFKESDGKYTYWIAIEMPKDAMKTAISGNISANEKLQVDFDKHQFEKIFDEEMKKFEEERK